VAGSARGGDNLIDCVVGGFSGGGTPGPIPNPVAKPSSADGTALVRVWESRTPPTSNLFEGPTWCGPLIFCARLVVVIGRSGVADAEMRL
jgi:hypothetical protein